MQRQIYRSRTNKILAGVCGGIGEYFNIDPTIIRIVWALLGLSGTGIILYIVAAIIIPEESGAGFGGPYEGGSPFGGNSSINVNSKNTSLILGGILVLAGAYIMARRYLWWFDSKLLWSILLIIGGGIIIANGLRKH